MANILEILFVLQFIGLLGISITKIFNLFHKGEKYDLRMGFILFITFLLLWGVGMVVFLLDPETLIYLVLFKLSSWLLVPNIIFLFIEIIFNLLNGITKSLKPYNSLMVQKEKNNLSQRINSFKQW